MKTIVKNTLVGAGLLTLGYKAGKVVAYVRSIKIALDMVDEVIPGCKKAVIKKTTDKIIDDVCKS